MALEKQSVTSISNDTADKLKRKSAYNLPDRPSDVGMKPDAIKESFWRPYLDPNSSLLTEINRIVEEVNDILGVLSTAINSNASNFNYADSRLTYQSSQIDKLINTQKYFIKSADFYTGGSVTFTMGTGEFKHTDMRLENALDKIEDKYENSIYSIRYKLNRGSTEIYSSWFGLPQLTTAITNIKDLVTHKNDAETRLSAIENEMPRKAEIPIIYSIDPIFNSVDELSAVNNYMYYRPVIDDGGVVLYEYEYDIEEGVIWKPVSRLEKNSLCIIYDRGHKGELYRYVGGSSPYFMPVSENVLPLLASVNVLASVDELPTEGYTQGDVLPVRSSYAYPHLYECEYSHDGSLAWRYKGEAKDNSIYIYKDTLYRYHGGAFRPVFSAAVEDSDTEVELPDYSEELAAMESKISTKGELYVISSIDNMIVSPSDLPVSGMSEGMILPVLTNGGLPAMLYQYGPYAGGYGWHYLDDLREPSLYIAEDRGGGALYRYTPKAPYFTPVDFTTETFASLFDTRFSMSIDPTTYMLTLKYAPGDGSEYVKQVDFPLEELVIKVEYNEDANSIVYTLKNGNSFTVPISDIIDGLVSQAYFDEHEQLLKDEISTLKKELQGAINDNATAIKSHADSTYSKTEIDQALKITNDNVAANGSVIASLEKAVTNVYTKKEVDNTFAATTAVNKALESIGTSLSGKEKTANKVTSITAESDDTHYPTVKAVATYTYSKEEVDKAGAAIDQKLDNAVTESKAEDSEQNGRLASLEAADVKAVATLASHGKRISNLESTLIDYIEDSATTYVKIVPELNSTYALIKLIGAMSYKSDNLFDDVAFLEANGFTQQDNGYWNGISVIDSKIFENNAGITEPITISYIGKTVELADAYAALAFKIKYTDETIKYMASLPTAATTYTYCSATTDPSLVVKEIWVTRGGGNSQFEVKDIMLNWGTTAKPYSSYFSGLRDAKVTALQSNGSNLIPFPYYSKSAEINGVTITINEDRSITCEGTATSNTYFYIARGNYFLPFGTYTLCGGTTQGEEASVLLETHNGGVYQQGIAVYNNSLSMKISKPYDELRIVIFIKSGQTISKTLQPTLNHGTTALPYTPYVGTIDTLEIPEAVQNLVSDSGGVDDEFHDYIEFTEDEDGKPKVNFVQRTFRVSFDGTEVWELQSINESGIANFGFALSPRSNGDTFVCSHYEKDQTLIANTVKEGCLIAPSIIYLRTKKYTTVETWKAHLAELYAAGNPLTIRYALAEPIVTDITEHFDRDNLMKIQANGSILAVNEYGYPVPVTVGYSYKKEN